MTTLRHNAVRAAVGLVALAGLAVGLCGCSGEALVDERNIYYIRGVKLREQKNHEEAAQAFETCLRLSPQSAQAHLQLALLYDEPLNDPLIAVYHYRQFLAMRPDDPNAETAKEWLAKAEQKLIQRLQQAAVYAALNQGGSGVPLPDSASPGARELALLARVQELTQANEGLRRRLGDPVIDPDLLPPAPAAAAPGPPAAPPPRGASALSPSAVPAIAGPAAPVGTVPAAGLPVVAPAVVAPVAPAVPAAATPPASAGRTHVVVKGDTLSNLARRYYGNMSYWPQLQQANRDVLGGKDELKLGMALRIPPLEQVKAQASAGLRRSR